MITHDGSWWCNRLVLLVEAAGIHADELDVILSRVKLAQLLGRGEGSAQLQYFEGSLVHRWRESPSKMVGSQMDNMMGRKCKLECSSWALDIGWLHYAQCCDSGAFLHHSSPSQSWISSSSWEDLQAEKLLEFFFGHRSHSESFGKGPVQRWLHLRGCHLMLLMALTVKYRLSPLGVEDIIEQGSCLFLHMSRMVVLKKETMVPNWPHEFVIKHH